MDHAARWSKLGLENLRRFKIGFARVDDRRFIQLFGEPELPHEDVPLHVARRSVVVEVEPALADGRNAGLSADRFELAEIALGRLRRVVRMDARRRAEKGRVALCEP